MEEKERYLYVPDEYDCAESYVYDNNSGNEYNDLKSICNLLNQQDKENQQLKQQLHDLPKKIVEEIKAYLNNHTGRCDEYDCTWFDGNIDTDLNIILKKYEGENESNND